LIGEVQALEEQLEREASDLPSAHRADLRRFIDDSLVAATKAEMLPVGQTATVLRRHFHAYAELCAAWAAIVTQVAR
jgi:hypothetical protein